MADYFTPTVIQQTLPESDMTPLERLFLSHVFEAERDGDGWYFFSEHGPSDIIWVTRVALEDALAASLAGDETTANRFVKGHLSNSRSEGRCRQPSILTSPRSPGRPSFRTIVDADIRVRGIVLHMFTHACRRIRRRRRHHHGRRHPWQVHQRSSRGVHRSGRVP